MRNSPRRGHICEDGWGGRGGEKKVKSRLKTDVWVELQEKGVRAIRGNAEPRSIRERRSTA